MANKFEKLLTVIGKDAKTTLTDIFKYLPEASAVASLVFPQAAAGLQTAVSTTSLIQGAVVLVEQKYAAANMQSATGPQKLAEVTTLVGQAVNSLLSDSTTTTALAKAGITVDTTYVNTLITAIVGVINAQGIPTS